MMQPRKKSPLFDAPYALLPLAFFAVFVLCFYLYPNSTIYTHRLRDPDHYMRLNEVVSWLQGQSWYDLSVPRMSPGGNTVIHWSRLIDIPIAAVALPLSPFLTLPNAALAASFVVPFMWFGVLLVLAAAMAEPFVGTNRKNLSVLSLLFAPMLWLSYAPGNVDHHGVQVLIAGFGILSLTRILTNDKGTLFAVLSAAAFACGFWIGAEIMPWVLLFMALLGITAALQEEAIRRDAAVFGLSLAIFTTALIPIALPASEFSSRAVSWFSPAYAIFAALCGSVFVLEWAFGRFLHLKIARLALGGILATTAALAFFTFVPSALQGAFADYNTFDATVALDNINEAQPLITSMRFNRLAPRTVWPALGNFVQLLSLSLVALGICAYAARKTKNGTRWAWIAQGVFLLVAIAMTVFWQMRVGKFMNLFSVVPLTYLLTLWADRLKKRPQEITAVMAQTTLFLMLGPLSASITHSAQVMGTTPQSSPLSAVSATSCDLASAIRTLNDPDNLGATPKTIMSNGNPGPEILFHTSHKVVAGNFNVPGNQDAYAFFSSTSDQASIKAAKKWGADLVLICKNVPRFYFGTNKKMVLVEGEDGLLRFRHSGEDRTLVEKLIDKAPPSWLVPVEIYEASDYLLYRIEYPKGYK